VTGVSKFAGISIFAGFNNLNDIALDDRYASICAYTQQELENYFPEYLDDISPHTGIEKIELLDEIRHWYDSKKNAIMNNLCIRKKFRF
jgi:hypothetical protein